MTRCDVEVRADWVLGDWATCSQFDCVERGLFANRSATRREQWKAMETTLRCDAGSSTMRWTWAMAEADVCHPRPGCGDPAKRCGCSQKTSEVSESLQAPECQRPPTCSLESTWHHGAALIAHLRSGDDFGMGARWSILKMQHVTYVQAAFRC